jgi:hypothetical protein
LAMMLVLRKASLGTHFLSQYIKKSVSFKEHSDKETLIPVVGGNFLAPLSSAVTASL